VLKVLVMGGGCIGGSIAIKLHRRGYDVAVVDVDKEIVEFMHEMKISAFLKKPEGDFDVLILAVPMRVEEKILKSIEKDTILMDVSSVMTPFIKIAEERGLKLVGGHPMAGNERRGKDGWDPDMFKERVFFLSKGKGVDERTSSIVENIVLTLEAIPLWIDPVKHDRIVSKISHTTYFLSLLARAIGKDHEGFAGPGYESTTRLSKQNVDMVLDIAFYNRENILKDLDHVLKTLSWIKKLMECGELGELKKFIKEVIE